MKKINDFFILHHSLTLFLTFFFTAIAVAIGVYLAVFYTDMDYFAFLARLLPPVIPAIYFRLIYGKYQEQSKKQNKKKK